MDSAVLATRRAIAQGRVIEAARAVAAKDAALQTHADALAAVQAKDPAVKTVMQLEHVAALLEQLAAGPAADAVEETTAKPAKPAPAAKRK